MRTPALCVAILLMVGALIPRDWARMEIGSLAGSDLFRETRGVEFGVLSGREYHGSESRITPLREFDGLGSGGSAAGVACLVAGIAAAIAFAIAMRRGEPRRALAIAAPVSIAATVVFVYCLKTIGYDVELGWSPLFAIASAIIGWVAIAPPVWPARPLVATQTGRDRELKRSEEHRL